MLFVRVGGGADDRGIWNSRFQAFKRNDETGLWDGTSAEDEDNLDGRDSAIIKATEGVACGSEETSYVLD
jgi:hypothetical protein